MKEKQEQISSGIKELDGLLEGLFVGDNVVWYDDLGSLASVFCLNLIRISKTENKPLIYVCFDRSPKNLLHKLGSLANDSMIILDCFTHGKGKSAQIFRDFYNNTKDMAPCRIVPIESPEDPNAVLEELYATHSAFTGDVRFIFESLTGMEEQWKGEENLIRFYSHCCPRLYELNTIAYWVIEKNAHSKRLRAQINQIAQVAFDLAVKRGKTWLTLLKAEHRKPKQLDKPILFWERDMEVYFELDRHPASPIDMGARIRKLRNRRGLSQTELARRVGVTPSNISQVESNLIYPSIPALMRIADVLSADISALFRDTGENAGKVIFKEEDNAELFPANLPKNALSIHLLTPSDHNFQAEIFSIRFFPEKRISTHFFFHKGEEFGYLVSGKLMMVLDNTTKVLMPGELVYLTDTVPEKWRNPETEPAHLIWGLIK